MNAPDVVLVNTPLVRFGFNLSGTYPMPHLGLGYLAAVLDGEGLRPAYVDTLLPGQNPLENPGALPDAPVYLLSAKITNLEPTHRIARLIREKNPAARVVLGGPCNIITPEVIFDLFGDFDILATG